MAFRFLTRKLRPRRTIRRSLRRLLGGVLVAGLLSSCVADPMQTANGVHIIRDSKGTVLVRATTKIPFDEELTSPNALISVAESKMGGAKYDFCMDVRDGKGDVGREDLIRETWSLTYVPTNGHTSNVDTKKETIHDHDSGLKPAREICSLR